MGLYDEVGLNCAWCNERIIEQSKGGPCALEHYDINEAPKEVLAGLDEEVYCIHCGNFTKIYVFVLTTKA